MSQQEKIDLAKVLQGGLNIRYITCHSYAVYKMAIEKDGRAISYFRKDIPNKLDLTNPVHKKYHDMGWRDGYLHELQLISARKFKKALDFIDEPTPELLMDAVQFEGNALDYFYKIKPDMSVEPWNTLDLKALYLAAINGGGDGYGYAIKAIKEHDPEHCTPDLYLAAVNKLGSNIAFVDQSIPNELDLNNPNHQALYDIGWRDGDLYKIQLAAVNRFGNAINHIENKTPELCFIAVKTFAHALQHVKEKTPEICMEAVKTDGHALAYIDHQTPNQLDPSNPAHRPFYDLGWRDGYLNQLYMTAVQGQGWSLRHIPAENQTEAICLAAVRKHSGALEHAHIQTDEICKTATAEFYKNLVHVRNQTPELCIHVINQHINAIKYVRDFESIAHLVDDAMIQKGLNNNDAEIVQAFKYLFKIREANLIIHRIAEKIENNQSPEPRKRLKI